MEVTNSEEGLNYWSLLLCFNFKSSEDRILCHSLDLIVFGMIQEYCSQIFKISAN